MGTQYFGEGCFIRDRELGTTYLCEGHYYDDRNQTDVLLKNLRQRLPSVNFIGIRIMPSREGSSFAHRYLGYGNEDYEKVMKRWRKEKSFAIKKSGYQVKILRNCRRRCHRNVVAALSRRLRDDCATMMRCQRRLVLL